VAAEGSENAGECVQGEVELDVRIGSRSDAVRAGRLAVGGFIALGGSWLRKSFPEHAVSLQKGWLDVRASCGAPLRLNGPLRPTLNASSMADRFGGAQC